MLRTVSERQFFTFWFTPQMAAAAAPGAAAAPSLSQEPDTLSWPSTWVAEMEVSGLSHMH